MKTSKSARKKILLLDDEVLLSEILKKCLEADGFDVEVCDSGKKAKYLVAFNTYDAVVSDINVPGGIGGMELLYYIRNEIKKDIPVILMTGFSKLSYIQEAEEMGAKHFLSKPFKKEDLTTAVKECFDWQDFEVAPPVKVNYDNEYSQLNIEDFICGKEIDFDIYIRLSAEKYVKIATCGEDLDLARIKIYREKGISFLYLKKEDFKRYLGINVKLSKIIKDRKEVDNSKRMHLLKHTSELILEYLYNNEVSKDVLDGAKTVIETSVDILTEDKAGENLINLISANGDAKYAHQVGVGFYSVMMARAIGWNSPSTLYKLSVAGFLHDIGEKEIPLEILEKTRTELTTDEIKILQSHTFKSAEILSTVPSIPSDVIQVVFQHHESCSGQGYPNHLRKNQINPLARLISVADHFCNQVLDQKRTPKDAIYRLTTLYSDALDPDFINALCRLFGYTELIMETKKVS